MAIIVCSENTKTGRQCTRKLKIGETYCFQHVRNHRNEQQAQDQNHNPANVKQIARPNPIVQDKTRLDHQDMVAIKNKITNAFEECTAALKKTQEELNQAEQCLHFLKTLTNAWKMLMTYHNLGWTEVCVFDKFMLQQSQMQLLLDQELKVSKVEMTHRAKQITEMLRLNWLRIFKKKIEHFDCTVCQENEQKDGGFELSCKHTFHLQCILEHFSRKLNCPNCRKVLQPH